MEKQDQTLNSINGLVVESINHYYYLNKLVICFKDSKLSLIFHDCPLVLDTGIIGQTVTYVSTYNGEMGFVLAFRDFKISSEDYKYCMLQGEDTNCHYQKKIRIAYKKLEFL